MEQSTWLLSCGLDPKATCLSIPIPSWCGNDSTGSARQLCGGSRAFHQRNRGSAGAAHRTKRTSAGAGGAFKQEKPMPLKSLVSEIELINTAHAEPEVRGLRLSGTRGGDESRRLPVATVGEVHRTEAEGGGEAVATVQQVQLIAFNNLSSAVGKSRLLCEGLWGRAFLSAYNCANEGERLRMAEGLGKGAGIALLAVPMVESFTFTQSQFQRILSHYLGLEGAICVPHTHHCGGGVTRVLTQGTANHLQVCPVLGRNSAPHDAVRDALSHLVVQNGVTDAAVVETRLTAAD